MAVCASAGVIRPITKAAGRNMERIDAIPLLHCVAAIDRLFRGRNCGRQRRDAMTNR
jgi:hypothetical protein